MRLLLKVFVVLSFFSFLTAGEINVSGMVKSAADSTALNGRVTVFVGNDSTVLPVTDGYYSGSITGIKKNEPALPKSFNLKVYPSILTSAQHTITARISAPRTLKKQDLHIDVYNLLGQKVDISRAVSFQPLIIRARTPFGTASRRVWAAGPFELVTVLKSGKNLPGFKNPEGLSLPKSAGDSVDAIFEVSVEGYQTLVDTIRLAVDGPNENDFYLDPMLQKYVLSGRVTDEDGEPVDSAKVLARISSVVDTVFTDNAGFWTSDTVKSYNLSEEASVDVFKEDYKDWVSGVFDVVPGETVVDATLESNLRRIFLKYQDAGTKERIIGENLVVTDLETGRKYFEGRVDENTSFNIPKTNPELVLDFNSPDQSYLGLADTIATAQVDTIISEGIQNFPVNQDYWQGFKEYMWHISGAKFDDPQRRFSRFDKDSIPVFIPEKVSQGIDWRQTYIDSVVKPLNDLVRTPENPDDYLFVTQDSALADNEGIIVIYDNNNYTEVYQNGPTIISADVHWATDGGSDEDIFNTIQIARHETYLHGIIDGIHSPDDYDLFNSGAYTGDNPSPRLYERYLLQILRNKRVQNLKGFKDINE